MNLHQLKPEHLKESQRLTSSMTFTYVIDDVYIRYQMHHNVLPAGSMHTKSNLSICRNGFADLSVTSHHCCPC